MTRFFTGLRAPLGALTVAASLAVSGCHPEVADGVPSQEAPAEELSGAFAAVPREVSASERGQMEQKLGGGAPSALTGENFYVAIRKSELGQRWFLSAYLKQLFPGAVAYGAGSSLGTRVVSFRVQNDKLFVFDVGDGKATSDVFDPDLIVEAYPLVTGNARFERMRGADQYVLFDPTAGLNRFALIGEAFGAGGVRFETELSFAQRFRGLADGATWEQLFTGYSDAPDTGAPDLGEPNLLRASGTLGVSLRRYTEGAGFVPMAPLTSAGGDHYFRSDLQLVRNQGTTRDFATKWNIRPGMKPIKFLIGREILAVAADPAYAGYDVVGAMKAGVENWNQVFGFQALKAEVAGPNDSYADDDKNFIIVDPDPSNGYAFANWRLNPNTGEIRGASVYFNTLWLGVGDSIFDDDPTAAARAPAPRVTAGPAVRLTWEPLRSEPLCERPLPTLREGGLFARALGAAGQDGAAQLTKKQKVERYVTHVVLHEVGHTLGLRHNFKGSLQYPSSSAMEYTDDFDAVYVDTPKPYDEQAIRYLYGLSTQAPDLPFCTDQATRTDPNCATFDVGATPLLDTWGGTFDLVAQLMLRDGYAPWAPYFNYYANGLLGFARAGTGAERTTAYELAMRRVRAPLAPANATQAAAADELARRVLARLYLDPTTQRGSITATPTEFSPITGAAVADLRNVLANVDGVRTFPARRQMVDVLKAQQTLGAYEALSVARAAVAEQVAAQTGTQKLLSEDLLRRVDAAMNPYFR